MKIIIKKSKMIKVKIIKIIKKSKLMKIKIKLIK